MNNLYICDYGNNQVRMVALGTGIITRFAGITNTGSGSTSGNNGKATAANMDGPYGIWRDMNGIFYITEYQGSYIRKVDASNIISTIAGELVLEFYLCFGWFLSLACLFVCLLVSNTLFNVNNDYCFLHQVFC